LRLELEAAEEEKADYATQEKALVVI